MSRQTLRTQLKNHRRLNKIVVDTLHDWHVLNMLVTINTTYASRACVSIKGSKRQIYGIKKVSQSKGAKWERSHHYAPWVYVTDDVIFTLWLDVIYKSIESAKSAVESLA